MPRRLPSPPAALPLASLVLALSVAGQPAPAEARGHAPEVAPGQLIIRWKRPRAQRLAPLARVANRAAKKLRDLDEHTELLTLDEHTAAATWRAIAELRGDPRVAHVEPNMLRHPFRKPNDTHYVLQWHIERIRGEEAWDITQGAAINIAVIDTGIRGSHPDLNGQVVGGYDFISDVGAAGDGDGRDPNPTDEGTNSAASSGIHGTHVAGIIAARSNNNQGIAGICWNCKIVPIRALGVDRGLGADADIADAIRWAAGLDVKGVPTNQHKARIINLSFGGTGASSLLTRAVQDAQKAGVIVVAAAGNDNADGSNVYPAAIPGVITVGAIGYGKSRAPYSNFGTVIDVMAPGGDVSVKMNVNYTVNGQSEWVAGVLSTMYRADKGSYDYTLQEGTSQAAPVVSGVIGLMLSVNDSLDAQQALDALKKTADSSYGCAEGCGAGLIDAKGAVAEVNTGAPPPTGDGLPYGATCVVDGDCAARICRAAGASKICTRYCSSKAGCPSNSECESGLCMPSSSSPTTNPPGGDGRTIEGVGCRVHDDGAAAPLPWALGMLLLGLALIRRRRR